MAQEKEQHMAQIRELEANVTELLSKSGRASKVRLCTAEHQWLSLSLLCRNFCTWAASGCSEAVKAAESLVTLRNLLS